jgi:ribosomal protein L16 Arg81 hydroxylase
LIYPIEFEDFKNNYWEKEVLVIQRGNPEYYESLFSIDDVDVLLDLHRPKGKSIRIVKNQEPLNASKYENADGSLNLNQIYAGYADGYTVVVNEIDRFWKPLKSLCQNTSSFLNHSTVANMYLTPANEKALLPHYDTHDVYVVQVHGKKHWKIYDADYQTPLVNSFQPVFQREQLKNVREITLHAGDLMYIPRGVPHEADTSDESSLHLTLGVYPTQWVDLLMKSVYHLAHSKLELRQSLPLGFRRNMSASEFIQEVESQMTALLQEALVQSNAQGALQLISEDFRMAQQPKGDGHFRHLDNLHEIDESTFLKKRENMSCSVQGIGSAVRIIFPGNVIKGPMQIAPAFQFITEQEGVFKISDIPMLDSQNKIMLAKRLIRGGLLNMM